MQCRLFLKSVMSEQKKSKPFSISNQYWRAVLASSLEPSRANVQSAQHYGSAGCESLNPSNTVIWRLTATCRRESFTKFGLDAYKEACGRLAHRNRAMENQEREAGETSQASVSRWDLITLTITDQTMGTVLFLGQRIKRDYTRSGCSKDMYFYIAR